MATRPKTRTTRTRTELDEELSEVRSTATHREVLDPKTLEAQRRQDQATRQAAAALTVQKAAQKVAQVGIDIQGAVAKVSEQLMETTQELETVQRAVVLEREELAELHGKDVIASSIDALTICLAAWSSTPGSLCRIRFKKSGRFITYSTFCVLRLPDSEDVVVLLSRDGHLAQCETKRRALACPL